MKDTILIQSSFRDFLIGVIAFLLAAMMWSIVLVPAAA